MESWEQDQDEALIELLDPPLRAPLFPKFPGKQAVPYADLEPREPKEFTGLQGLLNGDFTIQVPPGSITMHPGDLNFMPPVIISGPSVNVVEPSQSKAQAEFDRLKEEARQAWITKANLVVYGEPKPATMKITDCTET